MRYPKTRGTQQGKLKQIGNPNKEWGYRGGVCLKKVGTTRRGNKFSKTYKYLISSRGFEQHACEPRIDPQWANLPYVESSPERDLYSAVLGRAIDDIKGFLAQAEAGVFSYESYRQAQTAHAWLTEANTIEQHRPPITFGDCLQVLDIPRDVIRRWLNSINAVRLVQPGDVIKAGILNGRW